jgi:hypothetical protein
MPRYQTHFAYPTLNFTAEQELDSLVEEAFAEEGWDMGDPYRTPGRPPASQAEIDTAQREYDRLATACTEAMRLYRQAVDAQQLAIRNRRVYGEEAVELRNQRVRDAEREYLSVCAARDAARLRLEELRRLPQAQAGSRPAASPSPAPPRRHRRWWWPF